MTEEFVTVLKKLIADRGLGVLDDARICRSLLMDYGSAYKREINLFAKALEKKFAERLRSSSNRDLDKKQLVQIWHDDEGVDISLANSVLNCLCHVLFNEPLGDSGSKIIVQPTSNTFTDPRDGKVYKTVKIGNQVWMAENLNYEAPGSKSYNNDLKNAEKYGRLYNWETAKKACPAGWHLPTNAEWDELYRFADGTSGTGSPYKSETAGKLLKATSGWCNNGNGEDKFGFAALPGGGPSVGYFGSAGSYGSWWSASEGDSYDAYGRLMNYDYEHAYWFNFDKSSLYSVRCLQDWSGL